MNDYLYTMYIIYQPAAYHCTNLLMSQSPCQSFLINIHVHVIFTLKLVHLKDIYTTIAMPLQYTV